MLEKFLEFIRFTLYIGLGILGMLLFQAWGNSHLLLSSSHETTTIQHRIPENVLSVHHQSSTVPVAFDHRIQQQQQPPSLNKIDSFIQVRTDLLDVLIDLQGGDIVESKLLKFATTLNDKTPYVLLNNEPRTRYVAESGLLSQEEGAAPDSTEKRAWFTSPKQHYFLQNNEHQLVVKLYWKNNSGIMVTKEFTFERGSYEIHLAYTIINHSKQPWHANIYAQLTRTNTPLISQGGIVSGLATYLGAAISTPQKSFQKITFKDMHENDLNQVVQGGWIAMIQHYFVSAWIPPRNINCTYYSQATHDGLYTIGMASPEIVVQPGHSQTIHVAKLFTGPSKADQLSKAAQTLPLTIDYGWFWFISAMIFWMMNKIFSVVGNWGWSIVLVTIVIKLLFYQLSAKSYRSMSAMKRLQPRIEQLKAQYGDDKQQLTQATLALYRQEKVNPMSGCLPILIQIPVFIALYWVLIESVELRQAPFILWIHDLSQYDPYYCLPLLMGASMFLQQRLNPPPPDPMQAKVMMFMPVIFTVLFMHFPAGLMLYWFVNNTLSFLQQWFIMHQIERHTQQ